MLKIQFKDRRKPAMWLVDSSIKLGSNPKCDIVIEEKDVEGLHCRLKIDHDDITITNLCKTKSIFVNDVPVLDSHKLVAWDVIRIGTSELEIIDPLEERNRPANPVQSSKTVIRPAISAWMLKANTAPLVGQFFQVNHGFTIGRDESADIMVPLSFISRIHARLIIKKDKLVVEDASSSNGTFVNGDRIKSCELRNSDELRLDEFSFSVIGPDTAKEGKPRTIVREKKTAIKKAKKKNTSTNDESALATEKIFLHDIDKNSTGKVYEIIQRKNHLSKMLGHHLSRSEQSVSARHIHLNQEDIGWEIVNSGAADGLLINGQMQIRAVLQDGDEITVGGTKLKLQTVGDTPLNLFTPKRSKSSALKYIIIIAIAAAGAFFAYSSGLFNSFLN